MRKARGGDATQTKAAGREGAEADAGATPKGRPTRKADEERAARRLGRRDKPPHPTRNARRKVTWLRLPKSSRARGLRGAPKGRRMAASAGTSC